MPLTAILLLSLAQAKPIHPAPRADVVALRTSSSDLSADYRHARGLSGKARIAAMDRLLAKARDIQRRSEKLKASASGRMDAKEAEALRHQLAACSETSLETLHALRPDLPKERQKSPVYSGAFAQKNLKGQIKTLDESLEEVKKKRQEQETAFENFDQKADQLFNILANVLKNQKEAEMAIGRNLQ